MPIPGNWDSAKKVMPPRATPSTAAYKVAVYWAFWGLDVVIIASKTPIIALDIIITGLGFV